MTATEPMATAEPFSVRLRNETAAEHEAAERSAFMQRLVEGRLPLEHYRVLVAQYWFVYSALEQVADRWRSDGLVGGFVADELTRRPGLEADLTALYGRAWRTAIEPLPATTIYRDRLVTAAGRSREAFVAHHYTRYLGDLSGGRLVGRIVSRTYGFEEEGIAFYQFPAIPDPKEFKAAYRRRLDEIGRGPIAHDELIAEARLAFRLNRELFAELDAAVNVDVHPTTSANASGHWPTGAWGKA